MSDTPAPGGSSFPAGNADPVAQPLSVEEEAELRRTSASPPPGKVLRAADAALLFRRLQSEAPAPENWMGDEGHVSMVDDSAGDPMVLHGSYLVSHRQIGDSEEEVLAQVRKRMTALLSDKLADALYDCKGGLILSPITFTINDDAQINAARVTATVNAIPLPDPVDGDFYLYGGRMHGQIVRVGNPAPSIFRIPWVPPVSVWGDDDRLILEYRRLPGMTAYEFASEVALP